MASKPRLLPNNTYQWTIKNKYVRELLGKPATWVTDADLEAGQARVDAIEAKLAVGILPDELATPKQRGGDRVSQAAQSAAAGADTTVRLHKIIGEFEESGRRISASDRKIFGLLIEETGNPTLNEMTLQWAERLVLQYKDAKVQHAPSTIRKRIGSLSRAVDWYQRKHEVARPISFGKALGRGYSHYPDGEKKDISRERFYRAGEEDLVMQLFSGETELPAGKKAYMEDVLNPVFMRLYTVIRHTGMRLKEAYWLRVEQIDFTTGLIQVDGTKGHYGEIKKRHVPMKPVVMATLKEAIQGKKPTDLVFPFWSGIDTTDEHAAVSANLSKRFARLFDTAGLDNFREHDLRHVATIDWVTAKSKKTGNWLFQESELLQMMGWTNRAMLDRYIKGHRADDLASRLAEMYA